MSPAAADNSFVEGQSQKMDAPPDSDQPSIIRLCNRQQRPGALSNSPRLHTSPILNAQTLQPSPSAKRPRLFQYQGPSESNAETLAGLRPACLSIPGPARAVQAALRRISEIRETASEEGEMPILFTQEYLRKAMAGSSEFDDDDFKRSCWVSALAFAARDSTTTPTPLGSINNSPTQRLSAVVAMVRSCTPNGFGDLMATLKDPTGTISATIHRSVFIDGNHMKDLAVGAVFVLQKVCIFSPRADCYLNITMKNIVKIFPKDFESSSNNGSGSEAAIQCRPPASVVISRMAHNSSSVGNGVISGVISNPVDGTAGGTFGTSPLNAAEVEKNSSIKDAASSSPQNVEKEKEPTRDTTVPNSSTHTNAWKQASVMNDNYPPTLLNDEQLGKTNKIMYKASSVAVQSDGAIKQMHSLTSLSSLPQWTDEQLEKLLVDD